MKILILSDSHGDIRNVRRAISQEAPIDILIHAGDVEGDLEKELGSGREYEIRPVAGNMDWYGGMPDELVFPIGEGHVVYLAHGHRLGVHSGTKRLRERAREAGADIAVYGHTHVPDYQVEDGITVINPGSVSRPRQRDRKKSYVVLTLHKGGSFDVFFRRVPYCKLF